MKLQLSVVVGCFFRTFKECSEFFPMGIYGVKCKLLATEMKNCNDKELVKLSTCHFIYTDLLYCWNAFIWATSTSVCGSTLIQLLEEICEECRQNQLNLKKN